MTMTLDLPADVLGAIGEAARRQGQTPEEAATRALRAMFAPSSDAADQQRRQEVLAGLIAEAQARAARTGDAAARQAYRDAPIDEALTGKFCRQGFRL